MWKLILLGRQAFLFNVTSPQGETVNLAAKEPARTAALTAKLEAWSKTLKDPNLPGPEVNAEDRLFFEAHGQLPAAPAEADGLQGWIARYGALAIRDGALVLTPTPRSPQAAFVVRQGLMLTGPLTLTLKLQGSPKGEGAVAWRRDGEQTFTQKTFTLAPECTATIPDDGKIVHLRLLFPKGTVTAITEIVLRDKTGKVVSSWEFGKK